MLPFLMRWLPQMLLSLAVVGTSMALLWWRLAAVKRRSSVSSVQSELPSGAFDTTADRAVCGCQQRCSDHLYQINEPTDV